MNKEYCIYQHECRINGKIYIGQTCQNVSRRWRNGDGYKQNAYFYSAIKFYGWNNFSHEIIESGLSQKEANEKEQYWIKFYHSNEKNYGYNLTNGGSTQTYSKESKNKMSESAKKRFSDPEEREKQSKRLKEAHKNNNSAWDIKKKPVQCLETGEFFCSTTQAAKWAGIKALSSFGNYFRGASKSCGTHPITGERLHWRRLTEEEVNKLNGTNVLQ